MFCEIYTLISLTLIFASSVKLGLVVQTLMNISNSAYLKYDTDNITLSKHIHCYIQYYTCISNTDFVSILSTGNY